LIQCPLFSVIVPCFNAEKTIIATLASIQDQTCSDLEIICVDDGSTDRTRVLLADLARGDPRIQLVQNAGKGPSVARNLGAIHYAKGALVAFCDADDQWLPGKLAQLAGLFADDGIDGAFGQVGFFDRAPQDAVTFSTVPQQALTIDMLLGENPVCTMSNITLRRRVFLAGGGFDAAMIHNEDLEWLIRLVGQGACIRGTPLLQTWYRTTVGGLSTDLEAMMAGRMRAVQTAARFDVRPSGQSDAIYHRYLARRALRVQAARTEALGHVVRGLCRSPVGFMRPLRRGALTCAGAIAAAALPRTLTRSLFS
jgi:glycosyltransferase involved in cell wall biosynthesis